MQALQNISPVPIRMMNVEGDAKGYYHQTEKYIAIKEDMSNVPVSYTHLDVYKRQLQVYLWIQR